MRPWLPGRGVGLASSMAGAWVPLCLGFRVKGFRAVDISELREAVGVGVFRGARLSYW